MNYCYCPLTSTGTYHKILLVQDCSFRQCSSLFASGGGVYVYHGNEKTLLDGCTFTGCSAVAGSGGAIQFWDANAGTSIVDVFVDGCRANSGGGMGFEEVS
jgi:hypothetical protein